MKIELTRNGYIFSGKLNEKIILNKLYEECKRCPDSYKIFLERSDDKEIMMSRETNDYGRSRCEGWKHVRSYDFFDYCDRNTFKYLPKHIFRDIHEGELLEEETEEEINVEI
jgi:hypothetical protein